MSAFDKDVRYGIRALRRSPTRFFLHKDKEVTDKDSIRSSTGTSDPHGGTVDRGGTWLQDLSAEDG